MAQPHEPLTILMAEDEEELGDAIELVLADRGHLIVRARDGQQALDLLDRTRPDVLLLDISMPRVDGFGVLRALKSRDGRVPPVIVMSAFHDFLGETLAMGATTTLQKPFAPEDLDDALWRAISHLQQEVPAEKAITSLPGANDLLEQGSQDPDDEIARLERLYCLRVMSPDRDDALDELVKATAELLRAPIALVSIITEDRQWWKAMHGVGGDLQRSQGTHRELSFCTHAVAARSPLIVHDAKEHPIFKENSLVRQGFLNAYAGVPVVIPGVGALGTLCVLDSHARVFTQLDLELLSLLAARVAAEVEWREHGPNDPRPMGVFRYLSLLDERYGVYNPTSFSSFLGVIGRITLAEGGTFALLGFRPSRPDLLSVLIKNLQKVSQPGDIIGWIDGGSFGTILPRCDRARAEAFVGAVAAEHRRTCGEDLPVSVLMLEPGAIAPHEILYRMRARLHPGGRPGQVADHTRP